MMMVCMVAIWVEAWPPVFPVRLGRVRVSSLSMMFMMLMMMMMVMMMMMMSPVTQPCHLSLSDISVLPVFTSVRVSTVRSIQFFAYFYHSVPKMYTFFRLLLFMIGNKLMIRIIIMKSFIFFFMFLLSCSGAV